MKHVTIEEAYENLANAIIKQAVREYRLVKSPRAKHQLINFFKSDVFRTLTKLNPDALIRRLDLENEKKNGGKKVAEDVKCASFRGYKCTEVKCPIADTADDNISCGSCWLNKGCNECLYRDALGCQKEIKQ